MDLPIENGGSFHSYVSLPEGISAHQMPLFSEPLQRVSTGATRGLQRVQLCTGHTRQLLPDLAKQSFGAVFMDLWSSQYAETLAAGLVMGVHDG